MTAKKAAPLPWETDETPPPKKAATKKKKTRDDDIAEALEGTHDLPAARAVRAALRYVDPKVPYVQVTATQVAGVGHRGAVIVPWNTGISGAFTVDGKKLDRMVRAAGADAKITIKGGTTLVIRGSGHRFTLPTMGYTIEPPTPPPLEEFSEFDPTTFRLAARFTGPDDFEPMEMMGVLVRPDMIAATDRISVFASTNGHPEFKAVLPRDTFDDLEGPVLAMTDVRRRIFVASKSTGEIRMVIPWEANFVDVNAVINSLSPTITARINKKEFVSVLKKTSVVQRRTAPVVLRIKQGSMTIHAHDPSGDGDMESEIEATTSDPAGNIDASVEHRIAVSAELLIRLASLPGEDPEIMDLEIGDPIEPVRVRGEGFTAVAAPIRT